jgi:hypothetical protein
MWWQDLLWGLWNGCTACIVLLAHILGFWDQFPFYNEARSGNWYDLGFLIGAGSLLSGRSGASAVQARRKRSRDEVNV